MDIINTHTGKLFVDRVRKLEFVSVGDYGQEENVKADFLGLKQEIHGVKHHAVDLTQKWITLISTQKGCPMKCAFCDCPKVGFHGNASVDDLCYEVSSVMNAFPEVKETKRFNLHFARMGEPTFNPAVLYFTEYRLQHLIRSRVNAEIIHPVLATMLPQTNQDLEYFLRTWCRIKNDVYDGHAGLQVSLQSTDDGVRDAQFNGMSLCLRDAAILLDKLPHPKTRKYTLNFAITKDTVLDAGVLDSLFDSRKFVVKLTPIHETKAAVANGFDIGDTYTSYDAYKKFEDPLLERGWQVISAVPSKEEDSDRITCGNALLSYGS